MIAGLIILGIIAVFIIFGIICNKCYNTKMEAAEKTGAAYKRLEILNKKYEFKKFRGNYDRTCYRRSNPQKYYDKDFAFSCFVKDVVLPDISIFEDFIEDVNYNKHIFGQYSQEFSQLLLLAKNAPERNLCEQRKAKPLLEASYTLVLYYKYYDRNRAAVYKYEENDIKKAINEAKKINASNSAAQKERAIMSDSLRFQIFKRDNYTCQICGKRAQDGVELEVDHIIPISKGGKTIPSNLQTLCKQCNRGKRDNFMYDDH